MWNHSLSIFNKLILQFMLFNRGMKLFIYNCRKKSEKKAAQQNLADKIKWFNEHMNKNAKSCSINDVHNLIFLYVLYWDIKYIDF